MMNKTEWPLAAAAVCVGFGLFLLGFGIGQRNADRACEAALRGATAADSLRFYRAAAGVCSQKEEASRG
jgi:hypothetical protein